MKTLQAHVSTGMPGVKSTMTIPAADVNFSEKEMEKLVKQFNKDTRAIEFVGGTTYCINYKDPKGVFTTHRLKSSSLDELQEMYKCAWKGKAIPVRKCFFFPKTNIKD